MKRRVLAMVALTLALGCVRSRAWHLPDGPTPPEQLQRDLAGCRLASEQTAGTRGGYVRRSAFNDCMIERGYLKGYAKKGRGA